jgi:hypothetical protein
VLEKGAKHSHSATDPVGNHRDKTSSEAAMLPADPKRSQDEEDALQEHQRGPVNSRLEVLSVPASRRRRVSNVVHMINQLTPWTGPYMQGPMGKSDYQAGGFRLHGGPLHSRLSIGFSAASRPPDERICIGGHGRKSWRRSLCLRNAASCRPRRLGIPKNTDELRKASMTALKSGRR